MNWVSTIAALSLLIALAAAECQASDFYVSPKGNDGWAGSISKPFATLERARDAIRQLRKKGALSGPVNVYLRAGAYFLHKPFTLTPDDSSVTYAACKHENVTVSGGRPITGFKPVEVSGRKMLAARIPEVKEGKWCFTQLFVNGRRAARTRLPRDGYYRIVDLVDVPMNAKTATRCDKFRYGDAEITPWSNLEDVDLVALHLWVSVRTPIKSIDEAEHIVHLAKPSRRRLTDDFNAKAGARYYVENVFEALDRPGQWYLDRKSGMLYYYPLPGEDARALRVIAPRLEKVVCLEGQADRKVSNVHFKNLRFAHNEYALPPDSAGDTQAAWFLPGAIFLKNAVDCSVENCAISQIETYAVEVAEGCENVRIERNSIFGMGGGGVNVQNGSRGTVIADNDIGDGGIIFPAAVGVRIGNCPDNKVVHNHIHDMNYTGVSVGWVWGYGPSEGKNNLVEYNHIHDIGRGVLSDLAGIYTLGVSPGTILRGNLIHDSSSNTYGGWGIYMDEGSTGIAIEDNTVYNTKTGGFHQHYGKENTVRNNVFAFSKEQQIQRSRVEEHKGFYFDHNIVYYDQGNLLGGNLDKLNVDFDYNCYWDASGRPVTFGKSTLDEWRKQGHDAHSLIADPLLVDPKKFDFALKPDSPALKLGFKPIDLTGVGPRCRVGPQ